MAKMLLEREGDVARIEAALERAAGRNGGALVIEGPAGIGKTALLTAAAGSARSRGLEVFAAPAGALESDLPFGIVRRLIEPQLQGLEPGERANVLSGAAELAGPAVAPEKVAPGRPADSATVLHGLYWLVAGLSDRGPLVLIVDDLHWADPASLRFLVYLIRRLEGLPVLVLGAVRTGEDPTDREALTQLLSENRVERLRPAPLSPAAVGMILGVRLGGEPDQQFAVACHEATGGTPFLVNELTAALQADDVAPIAESVPRIHALAPDRVASATMLRLSQIGPAAVALVRAVAVLGDGVTLSLAERLAEVEHDGALTALDRLVEANVLEDETRPRFVHPLVRSAIYNDIGPGQRSRDHARAAELLALGGAGSDRVASHLMATLPGGRTDVVERLRVAARDAQERGAPESAVSYLRRALDEPPDPESLASVLFELGMAEKLIRDPACVGHLEAARGSLPDPLQVAEATRASAEALMLGGNWEAAVSTIEAGLLAIGDHAEASMRLLLFTATTALYTPALGSEIDRHLPDLRTASKTGTPQPELLLFMGLVEMFRNRDPAAAVRLVERGLGEGRFLGERGAGDLWLPQAIGVLVWTDELDRANTLLDDMAADARHSGSALGFVFVAAHRVLVRARLGDLAGALSELREALALEQGYEMYFTVPQTLAFAAEAMLEREEASDLLELAIGFELPPQADQNMVGAWLGELRARILTMRGEREPAIEAFRAAGRIYSALEMPPAVSSWRSRLALLLRTVDRDEAVALVESELVEARQAGLPRGVGVALTALGLVVGDEAGLDHLRDAERVLRASPARLEHARALVNLGAALRRANRRADAREPLRQGLDLAHRCGAGRLAETAHTELTATGARPRRTLITGRDSLTPAEQRIAKMAAQGMRNAEIAQALFVTAKTVENQLGRVYKKLGITGRELLPEALEDS